jgi:hypothetical protein
MNCNKRLLTTFTARRVSCIYRLLSTASIVKSLLEAMISAPGTIAKGWPFSGDGRVVFPSAVNIWVNYLALSHSLYPPSRAKAKVTRQRKAYFSIQIEPDVYSLLFPVATVVKWGSPVISIRTLNFEGLKCVFTSTNILALSYRHLY